VHLYFNLCRSALPDVYAIMRVSWQRHNTEGYRVWCNVGSIAPLQHLQLFADDRYYVKQPIPASSGASTSWGAMWQTHHAALSWMTPDSSCTWKGVPGGMGVQYIR
jgi:hypothetical protein